MRTNNEKQRFLETLEEVPLISIAAKRMGISKATIYRWKSRSPNFSEQIEKALAKGRDIVNDSVEGRIITQAKNGDFKSQKLWLENNCSRYVKPRPINIFADNQKIGNVIRFENFSKKLDHNPMEGLVSI
ncbi:MAG: hypothetical protein WCT42_03610 [Candidatus Paceibacterota bacterium]